MPKRKISSEVFGLPGEPGHFERDRISETSIDRAPERDRRKPRPILAALLTALIAFLIANALSPPLGLDQDTSNLMGGVLSVIAAMTVFHHSRKRLETWSAHQTVSDQRARHDLGFD